MRISSENGLILDFDLIKEWDDVSTFDCQDDDLKDFLRTEALKNQQSRLSVTWLVRQNGYLVGYCTLINDSIKTRWINIGNGEHWYRYLHYPALKIARLATHQEFERRGIGTAMLDYATAVAIKLSDEISGCRILTVDSKNDSIGFYQSFGFKMANTKIFRDTMPLYKDIFGTRADE